jgi:hypothetical protein
MNEFYNNLFFYDNPPIELSQIITSLKPHMYTNDTILPDKTPKKEINIIETQNPPEQPLSTKVKLVPIDTIRPNKKDSLFWCLYIISYGYSDFMQVTRNHRVRQLEVQTEVIDLIQKNKNIMKNTNMKFTNVATQELTSDLLSITKDINYCIAMALCVLYKININLIDREKGVYIKFISNTDIELPTYAIYKEDTHIYSVDIEPFTSDKMETMNELICLESYLTPLKTISNYKITELMETASQLGLVDSDKKYKKKEIYDLIYNKIRW